VTSIVSEAGRRFVRVGWPKDTRVSLGMVFVKVPEAVRLASTVAVMVQVPGLNGMVPPASVIVSFVTVVVLIVTVWGVPLVQVVAGVPVKVSPAGKTSVRLTSV